MIRDYSNIGSVAKEGCSERGTLRNCPPPHGGACRGTLIGVRNGKCVYTDCCYIDLNDLDRTTQNNGNQQVVGQRLVPNPMTATYRGSTDSGSGSMSMRKIRVSENIQHYNRGSNRFHSVNSINRNIYKL